jgi:hypothetical protein
VSRAREPSEFLFLVLFLSLSLTAQARLTAAASPRAPDH